MADKENKGDGFGAVKADTKAAEKEFVPTAGAMQSNHNSLHEVNPVLTANLAGKADYNPMRMTPNRANDATDVTHVPESAAALVERKGDRPTAAEAYLSGKDMAGGDHKPSHDTVLIDPETKIMRRANPTSLAEQNAASDAEARAEA